MALPTTGQNSAPPTGGEISVPPIRKPMQIPGPISPTRGQTPEVRGMTVLHPEVWRSQTQKQHKTAEKCVPDEGSLGVLNLVCKKVFLIKKYFCASEYCMVFVLSGNELYLYL